MTMALLSSGSRLLSALGDAAAGGRKQRDGAPSGLGGRKALADPAQAEREAQVDRQRAAREVPDLSLDPKNNNAAPLIPSAGPLLLGGNSLLGL